MCKATCQNKCQPGAHFKDCGPKAYGQAHGHTKDAVERTAQACEVKKIAINALRDLAASTEPADVEIVEMDLGRPVSMSYSFDGVNWEPFATVTPDQLKVGESMHLSVGFHAAKERSAMDAACSIASELARENEDADALASLQKIATEGGDRAVYQLMRLVQRVGLKNWFDGDFVVLSMADAKEAASELIPFGSLYDRLALAIDKAAQ